MIGRAVSHQVTEYIRVVGQQDNDLRWHTETSGRSNIKHGDGRDGDTDSIKYRKKIPRGNRNYSSYICSHRTTSIPRNTLWGNSARTNRYGRNSNEQDNTGNTKKKHKRHIQVPEHIRQ